MSMFKKMQSVCVLASLLLFPLAGCGKKADEHKPIAEVQSEAQKMDQAELRKMAETYRDAILAKKEDVQKLVDKLKEIPLTEMTGEKATELKNEQSELSRSVAALSERLEVYAGELKKKGGDASGLNH